MWRKSGILDPKNLYEPCGQIKFEGTNVHNQIAFYAFHLFQACITCIILQLGDEDCKLNKILLWFFKKGQMCHFS